MSASPPGTDILGSTGHVRKVPIVLQKSFWGAERKFLEPLMRFARSDVRETISFHSKSITDNRDELERCVLFTKLLNILKTIPPKRLVRDKRSAVVFV